MSHWLLKTEPSTFGIEHLEKMPKKITPWDGVRNYQARNYIRQMHKGDLAFFYHSSCKVPGIIGIVEVVKNPYPDETAFDPMSSYYDEKSTLEKPRWYRVDVKLVKKFNQIISLVELRENKTLRDMVVLKQGNRLSVTPVTAKEWDTVCAMATLE